MMVALMNRKPISRRDLRALARSHILGHRFVLPGADRESNDEGIRLSHDLLEAAVRCCIDGAIDAAGVADRLSAAARQIRAHADGAFELVAWKMTAQQTELAFAYLLLEHAIIVRLETENDPTLVAIWLDEVIDIIVSEGWSLP